MKAAYGPPRDPEWCAEQVRAMWCQHSQAAIAARIGLTPHLVRRIAKTLGLPTVHHRDRLSPSFEEWRQVAIEEAERAGLKRMAVINGTLGAGVSAARWRAWRRLLESGRGYSLAGIGRTSGFDHTSLINGLRRLESSGSVGGDQLMGVR